MFSSLRLSAASFRILSFILVFLFAGAIVGETVALSMVVSVAGAEILSKLYLINGFLLFLLPPFFFKNIDRVNRGKLLSFLLLFSACLLLVIFTGLKAGMYIYERPLVVLLWIIYPLSYLSKTVLFLTFWTLANDVCQRGEAKRAFPKVAAWGFIGGMLGAWIARVLLEIVEADMIILIWASAYFIAYMPTRQVMRIYRLRLLQKEQVPAGITSRQFGRIFSEVRQVFASDLIKLISLIYFLIFIAVFLLDYLFWQSSHQWFATSRSLASFQFSFYIAHSILTIFGLLFLMPLLIPRLGLPRIFSFMPLVLLFGSASLTVITAAIRWIDAKTAFAALIVVQCARYVTFENAFSPVYQMFFASISKEKRGRAKTILEGLIKPAAIICSGVILLMLHSLPQGIIAVVLVLSALMAWVAGKVRVSYMKGLIPELSTTEEAGDVISEIGSHYDLKILSLIKEYSRSEDADLRAVAVKILAHLGSRQALAIISEIYKRERQVRVREMVARSLTNFYWYDTKAFIEALVCDSNPRIRSNAVFSLNEMNCNWKWRLKDTIKAMLFDGSIRVRIEAARYLWNTADKAERETVAAFMASLCESKNVNKRSAGLYLASTLKPEGWDRLLMDNLRSTSFQVYTRCVDAIFTSAPQNVQIESLRIINELSREHIAELGRTLVRCGRGARKTIVAFLPEAKNRRLIFELVHALRMMLDGTAGGTKGGSLDKETEQFISQWIFRELEKGYRDACVWLECRLEHGRFLHESCMQLLDDAVRERLLRIGEWALDAHALLERQKGVIWKKRDFDINDYADRMDIVEMLENCGADVLPSLIAPILRSDPWAEIARTGRRHFGINDSESRAGMGHFLRSENKWICVCALNVLAHIGEGKRLLKEERGMVEELAADKYVYLSRAAQQALGVAGIDGVEMNDTFAILETVLFFKKTLLFRNVPAEKIMAFAEISKPVQYKRDTLISREGDISDHLYVVKRGSLKIVKVKNNVRTILSIIRQGEAYGEIGLLNQAPRSASAIANEDCDLYVVQRSALKKLLMETPEIAYNFLEIFSDKLRKAGEEVALLQTTLSGKLYEDSEALKT